MSDPDSISIATQPRYLPAQSDPDAGQYAFAYTITIANHGEAPAQLLRRYWRITDADGHVEEVRGDGVVGEQPVIHPQNHFAYTSGAIIDTPVGAMEGHYVFRGDDGDEFTVSIPVFSLRSTGAVH